LLQTFDLAWVISLRERRDRRRQVTQELSSLGLSFSHPGLEFYDAVRPASAAGFFSVGARGCFMSHLGALRSARDARAERVLMMEDDIAFSPLLSRVENELCARLERDDWDFAYLGHPLELNPRETFALEPMVGSTVDAHFYAVRGQCLTRLVDYLEAALDRPPGHPAGGPMHVDGAFNMFRQTNPDLVTLIANPSLAKQRRSRSDITTAWWDRVPGLRLGAAVMRAFRR
jgi:glycosyl transferase family 25